MAQLTARANEDRPMTGIGLMLVAFFIFSCIDVSAKWLGTLTVPALQLVFFRYAGHFVISTSLIMRGGADLSRFGSAHWKIVTFRGFLLMLSTLLNFISLKYLPLTLTATILFSAPIMICLLSMWLLNEKIGIWRWGAILLGFSGVVVAIRPFGEGFHWAVFLSIGAAFSFSLYSILTRKLSGVVATDTMQFFTGFVGAGALLPFAIFYWQSPDSVFQWMVMIFLGFFGWAGHELLTRAHGFAPASTLSPFGYTFIIYLTIWSMLVFDHLPTPWTIAGAAIITVAGLIIWFREVRLARAARRLGPHS